MDPEKTYVTPAADRTVIDAVRNDALPPEGREVERTIYWIRRINEGDVTEGYPAKSAKQTKE